MFHDGDDVLKAQNLIKFGSDQEITGLDRLDDSTQDSKDSYGPTTMSLTWAKLAC